MIYNFQTESSTFEIHSVAIAVANFQNFAFCGLVRNEPAEISTLTAVDWLMYVGPCTTCWPRSFCPEGVVLIQLVPELFYTVNAASELLDGGF
jgi:hypothetical protein